MKKVLMLVAASASLLLVGCGSESDDQTNGAISASQSYNVNTNAASTYTSTSNGYDVNVAKDDALAIARQFKAIAAEIALPITQYGVNFFSGQPYETAEGCNQNAWGQMEHDNGPTPTAQVNITGIGCRDDQGHPFFTMIPTGDGYPIGNDPQRVIAHNTITFDAQGVALLNDGDTDVAAVVNYTVNYNTKYYLFKTANNGTELQVVAQTQATPHYHGDKTNSVNFWKDGFAQTASDDVVIKIDLVNL